MNAKDIIDLRKNKNWSQVELAKYLGVNQTTVSRWEKGAPIKGPALKLILVLHEQAKLKKECVA